nr:structural polyprotein [Horse nettle virus A]
MGFAELFAGPLGVLAHAKARCQGALRAGPYGDLFASLAAATPAMVEEFYNSAWSIVDSERSLKPLTKDIFLDIIEPMRCTERCSMAHGPLPTRRFCSCGGVEPATEVVQVEREYALPDCPKGRNFCQKRRSQCCRHGGTGKEIFSEIEERRQPPCTRCGGSGIINSTALDKCREAYLATKKTWDMPSVPLCDDVLHEGTVLWKKHTNQCRAYCHPEYEWCTASEWMQAAQIVKDCLYRRSGISLTRGPPSARNTKFFTAELWDWIPALKTEVGKIFSAYHQIHTPGYEEPSDLMDAFVKRRLGEPIHEIVKYVVTPASPRFSIPEGDFTNFLGAVESLQSQMEEFLDVFYDCASSFNGCLELSLDDSGKPYLCEGQLAGVQVCIKTPRVSHEPLRENHVENQHSSSCGSHLDYLAGLYANLYLRNADSVQPVLMAHQDQEECEDQLDHLDNKQGGELFSTPSFIRMLKDKRKEVRGKEFVDGSENRLIRSLDLELDKKDVFLSHSILENLKQSGIVRRFGRKDPKLTKICVDLKDDQEIIKYPSKSLQQTRDGILTAQVFTVLNRPEYNKLNKLSEAGWKEAKAVCINLHIRSYVPVHTPLYAFCVIMWGHSSNAELASLCGAYVYLGDQEASMLSLPLLCGYIGNSLQDYDAYQRSLVLSTVFFGPTGLRAGQPVFGITSVEFTEYMPSSYGGITHERDSWNAMLRNHQGKDKGRYIAGFNVVDAIESQKEKAISFPDFDLAAVPSSQPTVREFGVDYEKQPHINKSQSLRVGTFSRFSAGNIPVQSKKTLDSEAITSQLGQASVLREVGSADPTLQNVQCGTMRIKGGLNCAASQCSGENFLAVELVKMPSELKQGTILAKVNILDSIAANPTETYNRWLRQGYMDTDVMMVSHLASNVYSGLAIYYAFDGYGAMPADITTEVNMDQLRQFPCFIQVLSDASTNVHILDFGKLIGHTLFAGSKGFANPIIYVVVGTQCNFPTSTNGYFDLEFYSTGLKKERGFAHDAVLEYPISPNSLSDLGLTLLPQRVVLGSAAVCNFPFNWARSTKSVTQTYSYAAALLTHFLGVGGTVHLKLYVVSSVFVTCKLRVAMWNSIPDATILPIIPHVDIEARTQDLDLQIQDPFVCSSVFGDTGAQIVVAPLCTPFAPEKVESSFEFIICVKGITVETKLCKTINYTERFAWFMMEVKDAKNMTSLLIPARCVDLKHPAADFTHYRNAFTIMCAATGMHGGDVILHFHWSMTGGGKKASDMVGQVSISAGMGPGAYMYRGEIKYFNMLQDYASMPIKFGTFAGPAPAVASTHEHLNWINFWVSDDWQYLKSLYVTIEVLPGFRFYGRSAGPFAALPKKIF